jgi:hypothetical protein
MSERVRKIDGLDVLIRKWQRRFDVDDHDYRVSGGEESVGFYRGCPCDPLGQRSSNPDYAGICVTPDFSYVGFSLGVRMDARSCQPADYLAALQRLEANKRALLALGYAVPAKIDEEEKKYDILEYRWSLGSPDAARVNKVLRDFSTLVVG